VVAWIDNYLSSTPCEEILEQSSFDYCFMSHAVPLITAPNSAYN